MRTLFFGTPSLAVPYLELLARQTELKAVVTTPDEPAGRGYELQPTPVKKAALDLQVPVFQPANLKDPDFLTKMKALSADIGIVVAYGKLLPSELLKTPQHGFVNVHFSLLPAYRGAAPIQRALMKGEKKTGVSLFWLDEGMDTGPIFLQKELQVEEEDDAESLRQKLIPLGVQALEEMLSRLGDGKIIRTPQQGAASLAPSLKKEEGQINWSSPASTIANLVRGTYPWPGAFTFVDLGGKTQRLKILQVKLGEDEKAGSAGEVIRLVSGNGFVVRCERGSLHILKVQPEGKRPMAAWDFWQGARLKQGVKLG